ncbi:MAG: acyltransferase [Oscillospiraceae bacterium]|nr:acyltransferase [Oscillospiraceae bacterium]
MSDLQPAANGAKPRVLQRESNFELLRIIAMLMIVLHHFAYHGKFQFPEEGATLNQLWTQFILVGGKVGVDIFVLISGYFLILSKSVRTAKAIRLWGQIFFYSVGFFAVFMIAGKEVPDFNNVLKHVLPLTYRLWWFASSYFLLYLLSPYLNILLHSLSKQQYIGLILLMTVFWSLIPTLTAQKFLSNDLLWFVTLYAIGGYIRIFGTSSKLSAAPLILLSLGIMVLIFLTAPALDKLSARYEFITMKSNYFYDMQRIPVLIASLLMFLGFSKIHMRTSKFINVISSATFGVYLIHEHDYVRPFLWKTLFRNASFSESKYLIPYTFLVLAIVYAGCTLIELIRIYVLEKPCIPFYQKIGNWLETKCKAKLFRSILHQKES